MRCPRRPSPWTLALPTQSSPPDPHRPTLPTRPSARLTLPLLLTPTLTLNPWPTGGPASLHNLNPKPDPNPNLNPTLHRNPNPNTNSNPRANWKACCSTRSAPTSSAATSSADPPSSRSTGCRRTRPSTRSLRRYYSTSLLHYNSTHLLLYNYINMGCIDGSDQLACYDVPSYEHSTQSWRRCQAITTTPHNYTPTAVRTCIN